MRFTILLATALLASTEVLCMPGYANLWRRPSSTDREIQPRQRPQSLHLMTNGRAGRSPCPMLNSLANHGYLPRNGQNISLAELVQTLSDVVNMDPEATRLVGVRALSISTTGNPDTFNLDDLNAHGGESGAIVLAESSSPSVGIDTVLTSQVIEHDGSLSRNDIYFGDNHSFNRSIWSSVACFFTERTISIQTAANARKARLQAAAAKNPDFNLDAGGTQISLIETALYLSVFGDPNEGNAVTRWVRVLFGKSSPRPVWWS